MFGEGDGRSLPNYEEWNELFYGTEHYWTGEEEE